MLTNQSCWSIPFFGALAALSRRLTELEQTEHSTDSHTGAAEERDPYRSMHGTKAQHMFDFFVCVCGWFLVIDGLGP